MTIHRKIGGIHWFSLGRLRIAFCIKAKRNTPMDSLHETVKDLYAIDAITKSQFDSFKHRHTLEDQIKSHVLKTYCTEERNMFGGF